MPFFAFRSDALKPGQQSCSSPPVALPHGSAHATLDVLGRQGEPTLHLLFGVRDILGELFLRDLGVQGLWTHFMAFLPSCLGFGTSMAPSVSKPNTPNLGLKGLFGSDSSCAL